VMDMSAGWASTYRQKTTSKKRSMHRRRRRQLAALARVDITVARSAVELEQALEAAFRLHDLRWAGRPERSGFGTEAGKRFHRAAYRALAEIDVPRIVLLNLDGTAIAFNAYLALAGRSYSHHLAFDPALSRWSPGLVNMLDAIEVASAEGITTIEFLGGAERYKLELADRMAPVYEGVGLARTTTGRAGARARRGAVAVRMRAKRSPQARTFYYETLAPLWRASARFRGLRGEVPFGREEA
jgi:CelD/BcsL family acetyltransferase involved in cellulose biosynthesis